MVGTPPRAHSPSKTGVNALMTHPTARLDPGAARILTARDLRRLLDLMPDPLLGEVEQAGEHDEKYDHLHAQSLARLEVRLGRPGQECGDILGILVERRRSAVGVLDA